MFFAASGAPQPVYARVFVDMELPNIAVANWTIRMFEAREFLELDNQFGPIARSSFETHHAVPFLGWDNCICVDRSFVSMLQSGIGSSYQGISVGFINFRDPV